MQAHNDLRAVLRDGFGRVAYTHKVHEKAAERLHALSARFRNAQILLLSATCGGAVMVLVSNAKTAAVLTMVVAAVALFIEMVLRTIPFESLSDRHRATARALWSVREAYLNLLCDFQSGVLPQFDAVTRRDQLVARLTDIYESAPQTTARDYQSAQKALKVNEDLTFSDPELDHLLPPALRITD